MNLQGVIISKIEHFKLDTLIYTELPIKTHVCPCCKHETSYIHDYRKRKIKDISAFGKNITLIHNHRRYVCKRCGKRFAEDNSFAPKYYRVTLRLINEIFKKAETERSFIIDILLSKKELQTYESLPNDIVNLESENK